MRILCAALFLLLAGCSTPEETRAAACEAKLRQSVGQEGMEFSEHTHEPDKRKLANHVRGVVRLKNESGTEVRRQFHCQFDPETDDLDIAVVLDKRKAED